METETYVAFDLCERGLGWVGLAAMKVFVTGGTGVIGRHTIPLLEEAGHEVDAPGRADLDLFDPDAVRAAVAPADAVLHLATRIPPPEARASVRAGSRTTACAARCTPILARAAMVPRPACS